MECLCITYGYDVRDSARYEYLRDVLSPRLNDGLSWPSWMQNRVSRAVSAGRSWTPEGWNLTHPTRLAFVGVGALAVIAAIVGGIFGFVTSHVSGVITVSYSCALMVDFLSFAVLNNAFRKAS